MLTKFNNEALSRAREGLNLSSCNVGIARWIPGEQASIPWTDFKDYFSIIGKLTEGSPAWNDTEITKKVDYETKVVGWNASGNIVTVDIDQDVIDFLNSELANQAVALLFYQPDDVTGEKALYIENVKLTAVEDGSSNSDDSDVTLTLSYEKRVKYLNQVYRILTVGENVYNPYPIYGLMWDSENDVYERTGSLSLYSVDAKVPASAIPIQKGMKTCVFDPAVADVDNSIVYFTDEFDARKKDDGTPSDLEGGDGEVGVYIPAHWINDYVLEDRYYYWEMSLAEKPGFTKIDAQIVGKYPAWSDGTKLHSFSNKLPSVSKTRATFRGEAVANDMHLFDAYAWSTVCLLYLVEYASFNSQAKIGLGNVNFVSWDYNNCISETGKSNTIGNKSGGISTTNGSKKDFVSYRGIEDAYGNLDEIVDGIIVDSYNVYVSHNPTVYNDTDHSDYENRGVISLVSNSYPKKIIEKTFFGTGNGGSANTYICDSVSINPGLRISRIGGSCTSLYNAGFFNLLFSADSGLSGPAYGSRVAKR